MNCRNCNMPMENTYVCPHCGQVDRVAKKIIYSSNWHYNQGLAKAGVRDLSGAANSLRCALKYNKHNTNARNLLGLIYYHTGEIVPALGEWVISLHFQEQGNPASEYIETIQNNPTRLQAANKVIQKYNQSLKYIAENNTEMAINELKRVVNMSPTYVRALQLLALLYMQRKQYSAARKVLMRAVKVDRNNMTTVRYMRELNKLRKKPAGGETRQAWSQISDPNPIVMEEKKDPGYTDYNTGFLSFINVLIGIVIGVAVIWLLVVPSITKRTAAEYNEQVVTYSAQIAERNKEVADLKDQVADLDAQLSKYQTEVGDVNNDAGASQAALISALGYYLQDQMSDAGYALAEVDPSAVTDASQKKVYELLREKTAGVVSDTLYANAETFYENGDYVAAIDGFTKLLRMDDSYTNGIYYMGRSYHQLGDVVNAAVYYKRLIQAFPNSSMVEDAQKYLTQIEQASGTVVTDAADADNAIINQPLPESETSEEEGDDTAGEGEEGE